MPHNDTAGKASNAPSRALPMLVIWSGLLAGLLLIAYRSYLAETIPQLGESLEQTKYIVALGVLALVFLLLLKESRRAGIVVTALYLAGLSALLIWGYVNSRGPAVTANPRCNINSLVIEAAGTEFGKPPRFQVLLDGQQVAEIAVPGLASHAATPQAAVAELNAAAKNARPFMIDLPRAVAPKTIEIRFVNDLWGTPDTPGDRNLFIKSIIVNGVKVPESQLTPDEQSHGVTSPAGTTLYTNGSLWLNGPFVDGCN